MPPKGPSSKNNQSFRLRPVGRDIDTKRVLNAPGVVILIAGATIASFLFFMFAPDRVARITEIAAAVIPARFTGAAAVQAGVLSKLSPLLAHIFVHASLAHIGFNLLWLLAFGTPVARRMGADNASQALPALAASSIFLSFYLLSGVAGALLFIAAHADEYTLMVGASGAVSGLLGGLVRFAFNQTSILGPEHTRLSSLSSRSVIVWTGFMLATNNPLTAQFMGAMAGGTQIAWEAHLGGYFFGLLTYPFFERAARGFR